MRLVLTKQQDFCYVLPPSHKEVVSVRLEFAKSRKICYVDFCVKVDVELDAGVDVEVYINIDDVVEAQVDIDVDVEV